jgi:hypothetical protein
VRILPSFLLSYNLCLITISKKYFSVLIYEKPNGCHEKLRYTSYLSTLSHGRNCIASVNLGLRNLSEAAVVRYSTPHRKESKGQHETGRCFISNWKGGLDYVDSPLDGCLHRGTRSHDTGYMYNCTLYTVHCTGQLSQPQHPRLPPSIGCYTHRAK